MLRSPKKQQSLSNPDIPSTTESSINITTRKRKAPENELTDMFNSLTLELKKTLEDWRQDMNRQFEHINKNISSMKSDLDQYQAEIKQELSFLSTEQLKISSQYMELSKEICLIKECNEFMANEYNDLKTQVNGLSTQTKEQCSSTVVTLESKIDLLEQQARQCNIEIANVPEKRTENLITVIENLGKTIGCSIKKEDIVSIHRVPHASQNNKPKNIIAKLATRIQRDNIISAYRLKKRLTSDQLGIPGTSHMVYINEHLTLRNKQLFHAARSAAKREGYKYVWTKHSTILARENDNSAVLAIRSLKDIEKIKADVKKASNTRN